MSPKKIAIVVIALLVAGGAFLGFKYLRNTPAANLERADNYFNDEDYNEARIEYQNVLREDPQNGHAIRQIGLTWVKQGSLTAALPFLAKTIELDPEDLEARWHLAANWRALGNHDGAAEQAREILDREPKHERAILLLANSRSKRQSDLKDLEERLAKLDPAKDAVFHTAQATRARLNQDVDGFKAALAEARKLAPDALSVLGETVVLHAINKDADGQIAVLKRLAEKSDPRTPGRMSLAVHLSQLQKNEEASIEFDKILKESDDYFPAVLHLADLQRRQKEFDKALDLAGRVIATDPAHPEAPQIKAQVLFDQGKTDEAIKALEDLVLRTGYPITKFILARIYLAQGKFEKGRARLSEVLKAMPDHTPAALLMAELQIRSGEIPAAESSIRRVLELDPGNATARNLLARSFLAKRNFDEAAKIYREWSNEDENNPGPYYALSKILSLQKKYDEAFAAAEHTVKIQPKNYTFRFNVVELQVLRGQFDEARVLAEEIIQEKDIWQARLLLGRVYSHQKLWAKSREQLFKALELQPGALPAYELLVGTYLAEGKPEEAIKELAGLINANPKSANHHLLLAMLHEKRTEYPEAAAAYQNMLKHLPTHYQAMNNLAYLYATQLNKLEAAEKLASESLKRAPEPARGAAQDTLGWILYKRGKFAEAHPLLERAAQAHPEIQEIQYHLGMARIKMGMLDDAVTALERASSGEEDYTGKDVAQKELAALRDPTQRAKFVTEDQLKARIKRNPSDAEAHLLYAGLHRESGRFKEAVKSLETATKINPRLLTGWITLAELCGNELNDLDKAVAAGRSANRIDPGDRAAAEVLGRLALKRGKPGDLSLAYRMLRQASSNSRNTATLSAYALACYLRGLNDEAQRTLESVVKLKPSADETASASSFLTLLTPGQSSEDLLKVAEGRLKADPTDVPGLMAKAAAQPENAKSIYGQIVRHQADFSNARLHLGLVHLHEKDAAGAEKILQPAFAAEVNSPLATTAKGALAFRKNDAEGAMRYLRNEKNAVAQVYLGLATIKSGLQQQGAAVLTEALKLELPAILKKEAQEALGIGS